MENIGCQHEYPDPLPAHVPMCIKCGNVTALDIGRARADVIAFRDDMRGIAIILNELVNGGARVCTHAEHMEARARADAALERLKARYGVPAGRGDTRVQTEEEKTIDALTKFSKMVTG